MIRAYKFRLRPTTRQAQALTEMLRDHCALYNGALQERRDAYQRRIKNGKKPGYPRFKGLGHFDTVVFPKDGDGCRWDSTPHDRQTRVRFQGVGHVRVHQHCPVKGRVKTVSFLRAAAQALAEAQRHLDTFPKRTRERSKKHRAAARKVARLHAKIRRQRLDHHHKAANALIRDNDAIAHERLNIAGMTRTPKPKPDQVNESAFRPNGATAKAGLNRNILDAGWGQFLRILANKAESAGRLVIPVDARNTSRTCPICGCIAKENPVTQSRFECVSCGLTANAAHVGALNIRNRAGPALCDADPSAA
ncbi:RNA-guided endonuclease InsQ/TnpB family protein [Streptomyces sp. NPDC001852]|uniref:RNA-guided endonuclease InsQ/TnpB family protein n=1 Tax=Streptomyces sp. NPDC001852 TaxID=3364619 RepID=UPI00369EB986